MVEILQGSNQQNGWTDLKTTCAHKLHSNTAAARDLRFTGEQMHSKVYHDFGAESWLCGQRNLPRDSVANRSGLDSIEDSHCSHRQLRSAVAEVQAR